ncbi:MAG: hypothetical protein HRT36_07470 [Alphaproteobacteria bacterium]|nr:hypothetical protein [Alphaproteobacteria bacterium]
MPQTPHQKPTAAVRAELLRIFADRDINTLNDPDAELIQRTVHSLIYPPALSRNMPSAEDFRRALTILECTPAKSNAATTSIPETGFNTVEISLVLQALKGFDFSDHRNSLHQKMCDVLRGMAQGNTRVWYNLSASTNVHDITIYSFLKDALMRAKSPDSSRMEQAPIKRSRKKFWDGGVSI